MMLDTDEERKAEAQDQSERQDLLDESERLIEFDRVRALLAEKARFFLSREMILESRPSRHSDDVERLQDETDESCRLLRSLGDIGLAGMQDVRDPLRRAMLGGVLNGGELSNLCATFDSVWTARATVEKMDDSTPLLRVLADDIRDLRPVRRQIMESLSESGDILDSASPRLGRLRSDSRTEYQRAMRIMEGIANNHAIRPSLQSNAVASRSDRLVLEVKSSHRQLVPGIIHDVSSSGQTVFVEPFRVVSAANAWRESLSNAQREEERILRKLSRAVMERGEDALASIHAAARLDVAMSRGRMSLEMGGIRARRSGVDNEQGISLINARHPLLEENAVPVSIRLDSGVRGLVITGPNTGGKTVAMKTLGLMALMNQSGMHITATEGSSLPLFDGVYADIGDGQSIDRSISTFSSHMGRVIRILDAATGDSLVLLDELGTGTDPEEGSALARAILQHLVRRGAWTCVTTHHRQVSEFASQHPEISNACVELDPETLMPNYRLIAGLPGRSYALEVADRLGIPQPVLSEAKSMLDPTRVDSEMLLKKLHQERAELQELQEEATQSIADAARLHQEREAELDAVRRESGEMVEGLREQLLVEAQRVRRQLRRAMREAKGKGAWETSRESVSDLARWLRDQDWMKKSPGVESAAKSVSAVSEDTHDDNGVDDDSPSFHIGDEVKVESLGLTGEIVEMGSNGEAIIMSGSIRFQARPHMMTLVKSGASLSDGRDDDYLQQDYSSSSITTYEDLGELDVRGSRVHIIESVVPQFIDSAFMHGLTSVRIIHGHGTGALREAVREVLVRDPHVRGFEPASAKEGGDGVTVALLE